VSPTRPGAFPVIPPVEGSGGEISSAVKGDGTYRAVLRRLSARIFEGALQFPPTCFGTEIVVLAERDAVLAAKGERPGTDQQHMARPLHHGARGPDRVCAVRRRPPPRRPGAPCHP